MTRIMNVAILGIVLTSASVAQAQPQPSSGMLLGVYAFSNWQGLRITGTIPGYSAHGTLQRNDVLLRTTADGVTIYDVKSHRQIERAKDAIGPNRMAALEVFRPGQGVIYFWVEFRPVDGGPAARMQARFYTEQQRGGARELFQGGGRSGNRRGNNGDRGNNDASSLFGR